MAIEQYKDIENGEKNTRIEELEKPFIDQHNKKVDESEEDEPETSGEKGSIGMVLLSTAVAVCGSFEFGSCVGYSSPTQSAIREDLHLSLAEYSMFGSILTIGAMIGAITSGRISDSIGRKGAMRLSAGCCIAGWLAVHFAMLLKQVDLGWPKLDGGDGRSFRPRLNYDFVEGSTHMTFALHDCGQNSFKRATWSTGSDREI